MTPKKESQRLKKVKAQFKAHLKLNDARFNYWWKMPNKALNTLSPYQVSVLKNGLETLEKLYKTCKK